MAGDGAGFRERRYTCQDGLSLYFRDYGDPTAPATPVLCLGGLTRNSKDFHDLATRLSVERRVICPDYRGRGRSDYDPDWRRYVPPTYLGDIRQLLALCGIERAVVVGTSMGGIMAMAMAVAMPQALAGAILNDVGPEVGGSGLSRVLDYVGRDWPQPDWDAAIAHLREVFQKLTIRTRAGWLKLAEATYRLGDDGLLHVDWDVNLAKPLLAHPGRNHDLWPLFLAFKGMPVLAVRGALSDILTAETFERMGARMPGLRRVTVAKCGHAPALDEPEVLEAINALLANV
jgi:pimeloyl-ACP methyl ester carboxylesterase